MSTASGKPHQTAAEKPTGPPRRSWRFKLLALVIGSLLALLLAEGILWIMDLPRTGPFLQEFYGPREGRKFKLTCFDSLPTGGIDADLRKPEDRARYEPFFPDGEFSRHWEKTPYAVEVAYNSHGFRDREFGPRGDADLRIVVVGDSFTYGHGLPEKTCYPRQLEKILRETTPGRKVEVFNCGHGADNVDRIHKVALYTLANYKPDILVYSYFLNDPLKDETEKKDVHAMLDPGWSNVEQEKTRFTIGMRERRGPRIYDLAAGFFESSRVTDTTLDWYRSIHEPGNWAPTARLIKAIDEAARDAGCRFILAVLPVIYDLSGEYPLESVHRYIETTAGSMRIEVIDCLPALRTRPDAELYLHPRDRHPNANYSRSVAETIASAIDG